MVDYVALESGQDGREDSVKCPGACPLLLFRPCNPANDGGSPVCSLTFQTILVIVLLWDHELVHPSRE